MLTLQFLSILLVILWLYFLWSRRKYYLLMLKIPGPLGLPLIGMAHELYGRENVLRVLGFHLDKHGPAIFSWLGPVPFLVVGDPQLAQDILTSKVCIDKCIVYKAIDDCAGMGLFSLKEPRWSIHRKFLNQAFAHKVLLTFLPIFNQETGILLQVLNKLVGSGEHDLIPLLQKFTLSIATQTTMGNSAKDEATFKNNLLERYQCALECMTNMCFSPWLMNRTMRQLCGREKSYNSAKTEIRTFVKELIRKKIAESTNNNSEDGGPKENNIFLNVAIDLFNKGIFNLKNVEDESNVIVFGAFETTANTVAYTLMMLAMFPNYQEKAFQEILELFPETGDFQVSYNDTKLMVYLDLIINETMRVMAPVPVVAREVMEDFKLSNGVVIPKGVQVAINIYHIHRKKSIWGSEAEKFNPDHFLPANLENKHPYAFIPFTKGLRNCIGWKYALISTKVTLAKLLRNYKFTTSFKFDDLVFVEDITMKLKVVPKLELHRRN